MFYGNSKSFIAILPAHSNDYMKSQNEHVLDKTAYVRQACLML